MERQTVKLRVSTTTAGADTWINLSEVRYRIAEIKLVPNIASTANDTNYASVRPYKALGTSTPLAAARATTVAGGAFVAQTPEAVTVTATGKDTEIGPGELIHITQAAGGSGVAHDVCYLFELEPLSFGS
ncbi:MAG: hypothetical protein ACO3GM_00795 [Candidatus Limnocylindrus sp.]